MKRKAFITGATGMDASHLIEFLLEKDYEIYGLVRRASTNNTWRLHNVINRIELVTGDMTDQNSLTCAIQSINPDEIYNMAAQSFVKASWSVPEQTFNVNANGVIRLLDAVRCSNKKDIKIYQASSSEQFGKIQETPQTETTKFYPRSIYGVSKCSAHWIMVNYRESYNMFICCGISFNHESYRRGLEFLSRKVTYNVAKIKLGLATHIELGNLDSCRDWGYAPDYVEGFWKTLQQEKPNDYVFATGKTRLIKEFVKTAFECIGITDWESYVKYNPKYMRPAEVTYLCGNPQRAKTYLKWTPKTSFQDMVRIMVNTDIERLNRNDRFE